MFFNEDLHSGHPHFHATYAEARASFGIEDLNRLAGELPPRVERALRKWARIHRTELLANWERGRSGQELLPIEPLQ